MSITLTHPLAKATQKTIQPSPVLWIAAAAMLSIVVPGFALPAASLNADEAQMKSMLVGP
jgi:hypothetical protein